MNLNLLNLKELKNEGVEGGWKTLCFCLLVIFLVLGIYWFSGARGMRDDKGRDIFGILGIHVV